MTSLGTLPRKLRVHFDLLRHDPERFGRNLAQFTSPGLFEQRLVDVVAKPPLCVRLDPALGARPSLNVLNLTLTPEGMTGGPNTAINLALRIARRGVPVRLVTTVETSAIAPEWFARHAARLVGGDRLPAVPIVSAADPGKPLPVGPRDVFMATHWSTAQQVKPVLPRMKVPQFVYLLQDFEPAFHAWSSNYALALETLGLDFWPVFNERLLADFMLSQPIGRLSHPATRERAVVFEPAVEERLFHDEDRPADAVRPRRLLFYARPSNERNLFGMALMALRAVAADPAFAGWDFKSIGGRGSVPPLPLPGGHVLRPTPWLDYADYARSLREADILLCPMLSPHTGYPVLEMAASGGLSVTNSFATKTRDVLEGLSDNIIAVEPTVEAFGAGLLDAARRVGAGRRKAASLRMARDWAAALDPAASEVATIVEALFAGEPVAARCRV